RQVVTQNRRAPVALDVLDDQLGAAAVADIRRLPRIVHGIGQVAAQHHVLAEADLLADTAGPAQDAHVRVHAHEHDVVDAFLHAEVVDLLTAVGDAVVTDDVEAGMLAAELAHRRAYYRIVAGALGRVHRHGRLALRIELAPLLERYRRF